MGPGERGRETITSQSHRDEVQLEEEMLWRGDGGGDGHTGKCAQWHWTGPLKVVTMVADKQMHGSKLMDSDA